MITFQKESLGVFLSESMEMLKEHYKEIAEGQDVIEFDPDLDRYYEMEKRGILDVHTARDEGKLVGYSLWFTAPHLHYKKSLTSHSDLLYVTPEYRKGMFGARFIKWTTDEIKKRNPQRILFHVKPFLDYGPLLERQDAHYFEKIYSIVRK